MNSVNEAAMKDSANIVVMNEEHKGRSRSLSEASYVQRHKSIFHFLR
jgi:hypothetical protein